MLDIQFKTESIKEASNKGGRILLTANIDKPVNLFQAQSLSIKTGLAVKSDQLVFAAAIPENNKLGLIPGGGVELLDCTEGEEVELLVWNRNVPGQQRMIEITPGMPLAELVVMPRYQSGEKPEAPAKTDKGAGKTGAAKSPGRPKKADAEPGKAA